MSPQCLDIHTNCIFISRHVVFDETNFPFQNIGNGSMSLTTQDPSSVLTLPILQPIINSSFDPDLTHATPGIDPVQAISNSDNIGSYDAHDSATIISQELSAPNSHLVQSHMPSSDATGPHLSAPPVPRHSLVTRSQDGSRRPSSKYSLDSFNPPYVSLPHIVKHHHIQNGCVPCKKNMKHIYTIILGP